MITEMDEVLLRRIRFTSKLLWIIPIGFEDPIFFNLVAKQGQLPVPLVAVLVR